MNVSSRLFLSRAFLVLAAMFAPVWSAAAIASTEGVGDPSALLGTGMTATDVLYDPLEEIAPSVATARPARMLLMAAAPVRVYPIPRNGLVAEYLFDGNANDTSGNGNNGFATTSVSYSPGML